MPVDIGEESGGGTFTGLTGNYVARPVSVAEKIVEGKDGRPDALRVVFEVEDKKDELSLFVPLGPGAAQRLALFAPGATGVPTTESALREWIARNVRPDKVLVYAKNGSIWSRIAEPGKHRAQLSGLFKFHNKKGEPRAGFRLRTADGKDISWTTTWPALVCKVGDTPEEDDIGPKGALNGSQYLFGYLIDLGLDWKRFEAELVAAYNGTLPDGRKGRLFRAMGLDGEEPGFFQDPEDITPDLLDAVKRHGPATVEVEVVNDREYGIGPKRGDFSRVQLTKIIVEGGAGGVSAEFEREKGRLLDALDVLAIKLFQRDTRFAAGSNTTEDGKAVMRGLIVPLVRLNPGIVRKQKEDGSPLVTFPFGPDGWTLNGVAALSMAVEKLLQMDDEELFLTVDLHNSASLLAWAERAATELKADMSVDEPEVF